MRHVLPCSLAATILVSVLHSAAVVGSEPSSDPVRIVRVEPAALANASTIAIASVPGMKVLTSAPASVTAVTSFQSKDGRLTVDVSRYEAVTLEISNWPVDEYMYLLEGRLEITDAEGQMFVFGPGDGFVMPKGFSGIWRQLSPIRKIAVSYQPASASDAGAAGH